MPKIFFTKVAMPRTLLRKCRELAQEATFGIRIHCGSSYDKTLSKLGMRSNSIKTLDPIIFFDSISLSYNTRLEISQRDQVNKCQ